MRLPSIKQLRYFVALCEYRHFGRAAESRFVSQSAFSSAIRELEVTIGVQLVERSNKHVAITPAGELFARRARLLVQELNGLVEAAQAGQGLADGMLRIGVIPTIAPFLLPNVLPELQRCFADRQLYLYEEQTEKIYARLMQGELDLLLLALPYLLTNVDYLPLCDDPFLLACHQASRHVQPPHYDLQKISPQSILLLAEGHCMREHAMSACRLREPGGVSHFSAGSLLTLIEMVDRDLGITFLPSIAENSSLLQQTRIQTHSLAESNSRQLALAWRKNNQREPIFREFGGVLARLCRQMGA